jgi:hypothetical protein
MKEVIKNEFAHTNTQPREVQNLILSALSLSKFWLLKGSLHYPSLLTIKLSGSQLCSFHPRASLTLEVSITHQAQPVDLKPLQ